MTSTYTSPNRSESGPRSAGQLDLSVVIPVLNESENIRPLCDEIDAALGAKLDYEIIFVDDGSTDDTADQVLTCMDRGHVRLLRHSKRSGQSAAVRTGVKHARGSRIATLDGDRQNDPADLVKLWKLANQEEPSPALVMGYREKREDSFIKRISSRIANGVRSSLLADDCPDSGCGIKIFEREAYLDLPWFDHQHRFLPALFRTNGYEVISAKVHHRPRTRGTSKYGLWDRLWVGIVDLFGVLWLRKRSSSGLTVTEEKESR